MDAAARRRWAIPLYVGPVAVFGTLLVLVTTFSAPVLLGNASGLRLLYHLGFVSLWYAVPVGIHLAQVRSMSRSPQGAAQYSLLLVQALVAVPLLLFGGWSWHSATGLLAASALVLARSSSGMTRTLLLLAAGVVLTLLPLTLLLFFRVGTLWVLFWAAGHLTVAGAALVLSYLLLPIRRGPERKRPRSADEPRRLAIDLHDILGGTLTAITLKGEIIRKMGSGHPDLEKETRSLVDLARNARSEVRAAAASTWNSTFAAEVERATALLADASVDLSTDIARCSLPERIDRELALVLRESVTNVLVHSEATGVDLSLEEEEGWVTLVVGNDGAPGQEEVVTGTGLRSIADRCAALGGSAHTGATPEGRFTLVCQLPA
ncbi:histidine kinase [Nocardiopsis exhalans]|uniref:Histidine kinase n=1 Tax=Nocardiopsis exhalans TaxID=163604 RepID=A0ABY5DB62_9ACTN|nr:histidine kinase [Nocardiopsis exhalans]USY20308.1 histidine kinase [Nocardiopsis exhalans]